MYKYSYMLVYISKWNYELKVGLHAEVFCFLKDSMNGITQDPVSLISNKKQFQTPKFEHETLSYEQLQALDDFELANVVIFGNKVFRPLQYQACKASVEKQDCFVLMPTGGGKSLCYQVYSSP